MLRRLAQAPSLFLPLPIRLWMWWSDRQIEARMSRQRFP